MVALKPATTLFLTLVMIVTGISCACAIPVAASLPMTNAPGDHGHEPMPEMDCEQQICLNDCADVVALVPDSQLPAAEYLQFDDDFGHGDLTLPAVALLDHQSTGPPPGPPGRARLTPVSRFDRLIE